MSDPKNCEPDDPQEPNHDGDDAGQKFLCLVRRNNEGQLVYSPLEEPLCTLLTRLFLGSKLDKQSSKEIASNFKRVHKHYWFHHRCDGRCGGGVGRSVMWVGTRDDTKYYMQRHGGFPNANAARCLVVRHFENDSQVDFPLPEESEHPEPTGTLGPDERAEARPGTGDDETSESVGDEDNAATRRPNRPIAIADIPTSIDDPDAMTFNAEPSAGSYDGAERGARYSGQRLMFSLATHAKLNRLTFAPTRDSQVQALQDLGAGPPGDSLNMRHFAFGDPKVLEPLAVRLQAAKETVPAGKLPVAYYVGAAIDVQHTGPNETKLVMHDGCTVANLIVPIRIPKFARPNDLARAPYLLLLAATINEDGGIRFLFGYAHPIYSTSVWFPVDADGERDTIHLMLRELAHLPITIRQLVVIEKDLFPIRGIDGIPFLADFRVHVACVLPSLLCLVETAGYRTLEYVRRKREAHAVMRRNGPLIKHRTGRRPRKLSDRVFSLSFRRLLTKRLGALHQSSQRSVGLPNNSPAAPTVVIEPSSLRLRLARHIGRIRSWLLARLRGGE